MASRAKIPSRLRGRSPPERVDRHARLAPGILLETIETAPRGTESLLVVSVGAWLD